MKKFKHVVTGRRGSMGGGLEKIATRVTKCPKCGLIFTDLRDTCVCGTKTEKSEIK